ncbi:hypothetical protein J2S74_000915 [Evansella vedderi]|uniref:Uncharacterized protein n=1 Tax=Evansella vedderi TaxID=38282 RepID=A0ABT9ZQM7_9BACI|nr:hypothetical protein [Evansella vedderi]MDQ0253543.1 hypothetical protein [Evansella vedderi]
MMKLPFLLMFIILSNMGIVVTEKEIEERKEAMFPDSKASERFEENEFKEFFEQAAILGVSSEEYFKVWEDISITTVAYMDQYVYENFGEPANPEDIEFGNQKVNEHIDSLFEGN